LDGINGLKINHFLGAGKWVLLHFEPTTMVKPTAPASGLWDAVTIVRYCLNRGARPFIPKTMLTIFLKISIAFDIAFLKVTQREFFVRC
jgi:hypothetical protein